jgi:hypothetical protein
MLASPPSLAALRKSVAAIAKKRRIARAVATRIVMDAGLKALKPKRLAKKIGRPKGVAAKWGDGQYLVFHDRVVDAQRVLQQRKQTARVTIFKAVSHVWDKFADYKKFSVKSLAIRFYDARRRLQKIIADQEKQMRPEDEEWRRENPSNIVHK